MENGNKLIAGVIGGILVLTLGGVRGCNYMHNNTTTQSLGHVTQSYSTGISGHVDYSKFKDGSYEIKTYPSFGHKLFDSKLYTDFDGDGKIDRIRVHNGEMGMNSLEKLLVRDFDYDKNSDEFDNGDTLLNNLIVEYN